MHKSVVLQLLPLYATHDCLSFLFGEVSCHMPSLLTFHESRLFPVSWSHINAFEFLCWPLCSLVLTMSSIGIKSCSFYFLKFIYFYFWNWGWLRHMYSWGSTCSKLLLIHFLLLSRLNSLPRHVSVKMLKFLRYNSNGCQHLKRCWSFEGIIVMTKKNTSFFIHNQ